MKIDKYYSNLLIFFKRLAFILGILLISRLIFFLYNYSAFTPINISQVLRSFFFGVRFDFVIVFYLNVLFFIAQLFMYPFAGRKWYELSTKIIFVLVYSILLLANIVDTGYFAFTNKRSGWEMLDMIYSSSETLRMLPAYLKNYWYLSLLWLTLIILLVKYYPKYKSYKFKIRQTWIQNYILPQLISLLLFMIGFATSRGIEGKPLRMISVNKYAKPQYAALVLNTPFTVINTVNQYSLHEKYYFQSDTLPLIFSPVRKYDQSQEFNPKNVVIIILESFGKEYVDYTENGISFTPFLDSLSTVALNFDNAFTNAFRSMDALPAIVCGFPSMINTAYINSAYSLNEISGLPAILGKEKGYKTAFFHGGNNGTMGFDIFCKAAGFDEYHGAAEFNDENFHDGKWGIFDEEFFLYMNKQLNSYSKPFFATLFSLSSHDPYPMPEKYRGRFPKGKLPIMECIAYTDYSLRKMFENASKMDWYKNTLFVICADHTSIAIADEYKTRIGKSRMPLIFFAPGDTSLSGSKKSIVQQLDIFPSVLDYLQYSDAFVSYGKSIFRNDNDYVINFDEINYQILDSNYTLLFDEEKSIAFYNYKDDPMLNNNLISSDIKAWEHLETFLMAYLQDYCYRMNNNLLTKTDSLLKK